MLVLFFDESLIDGENDGWVDIDKVVSQGVLVAFQSCALAAKERAQGNGNAAMAFADEIFRQTVSPMIIISSDKIMLATCNFPIYKDDRNVILFELFDDGNILRCFGCCWHENQSRDAMLDDLIGVEFGADEQIVGIAQDDAEIMLSCFVADAAHQFGCVAAANVVHQHTDNIRLVRRQLLRLNKSAQPPPSVKISHVNQILDGLPDSSARQPSGLGDLFLSRNFIFWLEYTLFNLLDQPSLQLEILGDRTFTIDDHKISHFANCLYKYTIYYLICQ